ncbi:MAG: elongation factor G [Kiritimatiellia bacterium]
MKGIAVKDVRNFMIAGHTGSGKTTLVDALLEKLGLNNRMGSVDSASSMADYTDEEKERKTTIYAKPFSGTYKSSGGKNTGMIFTDTPGYEDFFGQVAAGGRSAESALIAVDAGSGVQIGTHRVWRYCQQNELPRGIVVTGLDRENADFSKTLESIQSCFGSKCVPVVLPGGNGSPADVLAGGGGAEVEKARSGLVELAAETDDALIEKFLGGEELSAEELGSGLRAAMAGGGLVPVFACAPLKGLGLDELLEGVVRLFPSPEDRPVKDSGGNVIGTAPGDPFAGFVWRTVNDEFIGQLTFVRVLGGTLKGEGQILNAGKGETERVTSMLTVNGKSQTGADEAEAGDIVALPKLKSTTVGDTLCRPGKKVVCPGIDFPKPTMFMAVAAKTRADEDKLGTALSRTTEEDPTLNVDRNRETKETVISGLGDVHIEVAVERMKRRSNVDVVLSTPKVAYRETVTATGEGRYKHKKQSGGRGQYGEVYLRVEPKQEDDEEWFADAIVGGAIPGNFIPAVQKGAVEGMASGAIAGYPVTGVKVTVYDGSFHEVDSSEIAFKIAAARALKEAMSNARPVLLEPIMRVKVAVPKEYMGDITGDLNQKRGRILGMDSDEGLQVITADVPQAEIFRYGAELRSMTAGHGGFEMEFDRYENVPSNVTQKIVAEKEREKEES